MTCLFCKGDMVNSTTTFTAELEHGIVIVKNVPCFKCDQCGECYLNLTGGICPITACSKSLVNGQCGGSKNGKCEVDSEMECGWERIYRRLKEIGRLDALKCPTQIHNFATDDELK